MSENKTTALASKSCIPCQGGIPPLKGALVQQFLTDLDHDWKVEEEHHLEKDFDFPDFKSALDFTVAAGEIAEKENHHPNIYLAYGKVKMTIYTHKIDGLTESDFILAAKIQQAYSGDSGSA